MIFTFFLSIPVKIQFNNIKVRTHEIQKKLSPLEHLNIAGDRAQTTTNQTKGRERTVGELAYS